MNMGSLFVTEFLISIKTLVDELTALGAPPSDTDLLIYTLLAALDPSTKSSSPLFVAVIHLFPSKSYLIELWITKLFYFIKTSSNLRLHLLLLTSPNTCLLKVRNSSHQLLLHSFRRHHRPCHPPTLLPWVLTLQSYANFARSAVMMPVNALSWFHIFARQSLLRTMCNLHLLLQLLELLIQVLLTMSHLNLLIFHFLTNMKAHMTFKLVMVPVYKSLTLALQRLFSSFFSFFVLFFTSSQGVIVASIFTSQFN
ncbi:hypothetical protein Sjap_020526 [Stephania japonica]|uniref:Uncharacterized protein n=1 Tax=Stephania japonica TaxID=461633 RepID=A0AAP0HZ30_9MAGN